MTERGWIPFEADDAHVRREREKARALRQTAWWRTQIARGVCHYCGKTVPPDQLTMDHVVPVARGGRSVKSNCVPCCKECNNSKRAYTPVEMLLERLETAGGDGQ